MDNNNEIIPQQPNLPTEQPSELPTEQPSRKPSKQSSKQPLTIEELRQWYIDRHLPPEDVTRFFIGKNIHEPKAFGIYKDENGDFIVYKNKANGDRAVRYQGRDEVFAVSELLSRLKEEIQLRKGKNPTASSPIGSGANSGLSYKRRKYNGNTQQPAQKLSINSQGKRKGCFIATIVGAILTFFVSLFASGTPNGYYHYNDNYYYHLGTAWYIYDALTSQWAPTTSLDEWITEDNADQYTTSSFNGKPFEETGWYEDYYSSDTSSDSDSDYDWDDDDDSWDSDDTDWDDDW